MTAKEYLNQAYELDREIKILQKQGVRTDALTIRLDRLRADIANTVSKVSDPVLRDILGKRYLHYQKWDSIALAMHYSERHIKRLHNRALEKIKDVLVFS